MKKTLCLVLSAVLLLGTFLLPVSATIPAGTFDAEGRFFRLTGTPEIVRLAADSDENGTRVRAFYRNSDEARRLFGALYGLNGNNDRLFAEALGLDADNVDGNIEIGVQFAYSFDGATWVNDDPTDPDPDDIRYYPRDEFDLDGDDFYEFINLPNANVDAGDPNREITIFDGRAGAFTAYYCYPADGMSVRDAITKRMNALFQGKGEYLGNYDRDDDDTNTKGIAVDFHRNTLYVKARYRVYSSVDTRVGGSWTGRQVKAVYSPWSEVKSYNNANASAAGQSCVPDMTALKTSAGPTVSVVGAERNDIEREGVQMKETRYYLTVTFPAGTERALAQDYALDGEDREDLTGEYYTPKIFWEMKVADGNWFILDNLDANDPWFTFSDDTWWMRDQMEAQGYEPGDPVYLRARLYGSDSYRVTKDNDTGLYILGDQDAVYIRSGVSNEIELSLNGKYKIRYELNGGSFPYGTTQLETFDEETEATVDLTSADYTPERQHFVFRGWFTDASFAESSRVTSFDTSMKASRTYYAKWEELPHFGVSYDFGVITAHVYNPNPDAIYPDDGEGHDGVVTLNDVSFEGAAFLGWYNKKDGGNRVETLRFSDMTKDVTLYARWELPTYTIAYPGAGTDYVNDPKNPATFQIAPGGGAAAKIYAPTKTGHIFDGWFYNKNLKDEALTYDKAAGCWLIDRGENVTLYAKFILGRWDIVYVLGLDDAWNPNPGQHTYGTADKLSDPSRTGYKFEGWYADAAFTKKITEIPANAEGKQTVYAKWTAIPYSITYDLRDPNVEQFFGNDNPTTRFIDDEIVLKPLTPKNERYGFLGWYDNVNFDGKPITVIRAGTDKNVTLYAKVFRYVWGDVDFDGKVTAADARLVLRHAVELDKLPDDACRWGDLADHASPHALTAADARLVLRLAVGLETEATLKLPEVPAR